MAASLYYNYTSPTQVTPTRLNSAYDSAGNLTLISGASVGVDAGRLKIYGSTGAFSGAVTMASTLGVTGVLTITSLTASKVVISNASKELNSLAYDNANTASSIVYRDASGNFAAGTITASLTGTASNASTSEKIQSTSDDTPDSDYNLVWQKGAGDKAPFISAGLLYNPLLGRLTTTTFVGALTGNASTATSATSSTTAGTVTTAAQPAITSLGDLTSLVVAGGGNAASQAIKVAVYSGTLSASGTFAHGLDSTKIVGVSVWVQYSGDQWHGNGSGDTSVAVYTTDTTNIIVAGSSWANKAYRAVIFYQ